MTQLDNDPSGPCPGCGRTLSTKVPVLMPSTYPAKRYCSVTCAAHHQRAGRSK